MRLLAINGDAHVFEEFRQLALQEGIPEDFRTALLEAMYQLDQSSSLSSSDAESQVAAKDEFVFESNSESYGDIAIDNSPAGSLESSNTEFET